MKKILFVFLFIFLNVGNSVANDSKFSILEFCEKYNEKDAGFHSLLEQHKPSYLLLFGYGTPDQKFNNRKNIKFQFSLKQSLCKNFYIAYTQKSIWNIYDESLPFRESNYNPEGFFDFKNINKKHFAIGLIGVEHESNGLGGANSRSWWRAYWEPKFFIEEEVDKNKYDKFSISLRGWGAFGVGEENSNIKDYLGDGETKIQYTIREYKVNSNIITKEFQLVLKGYKGRKSDYGAIQADISIKYKLPVTLRFQFFTGYGESLIDYNLRSTRFGIGLTLAEGTIF